MSTWALSLIQAAGQWSRQGAAREFERARNDVRATQEAKLKALLSAHAGTEYGKQHGFSRLSDPKAYSDSVPFMTPEVLLPLAKRLMAGERNLLSPEAPVYYVRTSGSTGEPKHVPITPAYRKEFQKTVHTSLWHLRRRFPEAFKSRALYFVGSRRVDTAPDGNDIGTMSGFNFTELPETVRRVYAWPYPLFEVKDLDTRAFLALALATVGSPSIVTGIFPASICYLLRDFERHGHDLLNLFRTGSLPAWLSCTPAQRRFFEGKLGRSADFLRRTEAALSNGPDGQFAVLWPELRLTYCWLSSTAALFLPELQRRLGPTVAVRDAIYSACEGWCSVPMGDESTGGALAVTSHFFEFIEESDFAAGRHRVRYAWELEDGARYAIVFSTGAGLHRYLLGDIVEVAGFWGAIPRIRFLRKHGAATNIAGEKFEEAHISEAVTKALLEVNAEASFFVATPRVDLKVPGYVLFLEPLRPLSAEARRAFPDIVDRAMGGVSFDYGRLRKGQGLSRVEVRWVRPGAYAAFRQRRVEEGTAEAQLKMSSLVGEESKVPDEVRAQIEAIDAPGA